jgi:hypothetical protein
MIVIPVLLTVLALEPDQPREAKVLFRPEAFETLVNPACSHCIDEARRKAGSLRDDDRVLAWIRGKYDGGAIPYRWFLVPYRVISDTYGVFVYDADADFVRGWPASLDYRFHGWRNGVMVMRHKDGTLFDTLTGVAFDGPRKGEQLEPLPTIESDWGAWLKSQPGTVAYAMVARFQPRPMPVAASPESRQSRPKPDDRLDPEERVFGLAYSGRSLAWPLKQFGRGPEIRHIEPGGKRAVILWDGRTRTAAAYAAETEDHSGGPVTLAGDASDPEAPWVDRETGSRWSIVGRAVSGPRKGQALRWLPGVMVKWYAWAASYPDTSVEGEGMREGKQAESSWEPYRFLIGDWVGEGTGQPGQGSGEFSFRLDLRDKVLVRKNHAEYPATSGRPGLVHDDLMVVYRSDDEGPAKAIYFDNEGHVIHYTATVSNDHRTITFLSDASTSAPRFRLSYAREGEGKVRIQFEIAPPGKPDAFKTYLEGSARRK